MVSAWRPSWNLSEDAQTRMGIPAAPPSTQEKSPTTSATRYVDIRGVVAKLTVWVPARGPGRSDTTAPLEITLSCAAAIAEIAKVALNSGSSNEGKARR